MTVNDHIWKCVNFHLCFFTLQKINNISYSLLRLSSELVMVQFLTLSVDDMTFSTKIFSPRNQIQIAHQIRWLLPNSESILIIAHLLQKLTHQIVVVITILTSLSATCGADDKDPNPARNTQKTSHITNLTHLTKIETIHGTNIQHFSQPGNTQDNISTCI